MNPATRLARTLMGELVGRGVRDVVLSPGSRSAPIAFAAARLAEAGAIHLHVRVDERSAGFLAVGLARVSGAPVVVACTSGTAVANLAPAVVEASYSALPLVVVTADRPVEARGVGSPQTIDQVDIFGDMVRFAADLGAADEGDVADPDAPQRAVRSSVAMAMDAARAGADGSRVLDRTPRHAGPVHLNVGFRLPLVPDPANLRPAEPDEWAPVTSSPGQRLVIQEPPAAAVDLPPRGVLLVGDLPVVAHELRHRLGALASACGWPIVAEPTANLHAHPNALGHAVLVLADEGFGATHRPDLVVTVGLFGLSRPTLALLRRAERHVAIELPTVGRELCDPTRTSAAVLPDVPAPPTVPEADRGWLADWLRADTASAQAVTAVVGLRGGGPGDRSRLTGPAVAARLWSLAAEDALLLAAASWPVRMLEAVAGRRDGVRVIGNRGANGIDGLVSTAWGAALAHQRAGGGPALALQGDLAFLHDHNGLLVGPDEPPPDHVLVVVDNDGGGIFHQLEQGRPEYAPWFERLFGTPLRRDLVDVARAAGVAAQRVESMDEFEAAVPAAVRGGGVRVIVAAVPDRARDAQLLARVREEAARRIAGRPRLP